MADINLSWDLDERQLLAGLERIQGRLSEVEEELEKIDKTGSRSLEKTRRSTNPLAKSLGVLGGAAKIAFGAIAVGSGVAATRAVGLAKNYQQLQVSFTTFLGSAEKAEQVLAQLNEFSLATPFTPTQVQEAGKALLAFGITADQLQPSLKAIGDIAAGTGKDFNELSVIYGKARTQGTLFAEDINQLTEAGIPIIAEFAEQFGVTEAEVKKLGSEGQISFANLELAFQNLSGEGGQFFDLMKNQSQTFGGQISTLQGYFDQLLLELGQAFLPVLTNVVEAVSSFVESLRAEDILAFFEPLSNQLIPAFQQLYETLQLAAQNIFGFKTEGEALSGIVDGLSAALNATVSAATFFSDVLTIITSFIQRAVDATNDFIESNRFLTEIVDTVRARIQTLIDTYRSIVEFIGLAADNEREYQQELSVTNELQRAGLLERIKNGELTREQAIKELELQKEIAEFTKQLTSEEELNIAAKLRLGKITLDQAKEELKQLEELKKQEERIEQAANKTGTAKVNQSKKTQKEIDAEIKKLEKYKKKLDDLSEDLKALGEEARFEALTPEQQRAFEYDKARAEITKLKQDIEELASLTGQPLPPNLLLDFSDALAALDKEYNDVLARRKQNDDLYRAAFEGEDNDTTSLLITTGLVFTEDDLNEVNKVNNKVIEGIERNIKKKTLKDAIKGLFKIKDSEFAEFEAEVKQQFDFAFQAVTAAFDAATEAQLSQQDLLISKIDERISKQQELVDAEKALAEEGFANNLQIEQERLKALEDERRKAAERRIEIERNAANRQLAIDAALQVANLATSASQIFKANAPLGLPGILFAVGAIATLFSLFARAKAQAAQFGTIDELRGGGLFDGPNLLSHEQQRKRGRYHRIEGSNLAIEKGEWIIGTKHSKEHSDFLADLNSGKYTGIDLAANLEFARSLSKRSRAIRSGSDGQMVRDIMRRASGYDELKSEMRGIRSAVEAVQSEIKRKPTVIPSGRNQIIIEDGLHQSSRIVEIK